MAIAELRVNFLFIIENYTIPLFVVKIFKIFLICYWIKFCILLFVMEILYFLYVTLLTLAGEKFGFYHKNIHVKVAN